MNALCRVEQANDLIDRGLILHIAGDEGLLRQLHRGSWIGGTTPFILTREGGREVRDQIFVTALPPTVAEAQIKFVDIGHIPAISTEAPRNGFSIVIAPGMSDIHTIYAMTSAAIPGIREIPIIGWIAGVHFDERHRRTPKVFNGMTGEVSDERIVVLHALLPLAKKAVVGIVNLFTPGDGDEIVFDAPAFSVREATINGVREDFYAYALRRKLDRKLPLVTDLNGEFINVSFKAFDADSRSVLFYAPVMPGRIYRQAEPLPDYRGALEEAIRTQHLDPVLTCTCLLNYTYEGLEETRATPLAGPAVYGEIAHVLMNQTTICLSVADKVQR